MFRQSPGNIYEEKIGMTVKKIISLAFLFILVTSGSVNAQISPLQTGHYAPAFMNVRDLTNPPPGLFILDYNDYLWTNKFYDSNGDLLTNLKLSDVDPQLPDLDFGMDLSSYVNVPVVAWASNFKVLGATYLFYFVLPSYTSGNADLLVDAIPIDTTITSNSKVSGPGDMFIQPVGLTWSGKHTDFTFSYGFYTPSGRYENGADDNTGMGFWTHQFQAYGYYYLTEDQATAITIGLTYEINGEIKDADVTPGSRFSFEWGISQYLSERFELGIQGGNNWQVSDDKGDGVWWDTSIHDKKGTVVFSANYWLVPEKLYAGLRYGFDFGAVQRFKSNILGLNIIYAPGILNGKKNNK